MRFRMAFSDEHRVHSTERLPNTSFERDLGSRWRGPLGPSTLRYTFH